MPVAEFWIVKWNSPSEILSCAYSGAEVKTADGWEYCGTRHYWLRWGKKSITIIIIRLRVRYALKMKRLGALPIRTVPQ